MKYLILLIAFVPLAGEVAQATPLTLSNTTQVAGSDGQSTSSVGDDFATSGLTLSGQQADGGYKLSLTYSTTFSGLAVDDGVTIAYPDIFLRSPAAGYSTQGFTYALALGDQGINGGLSAGFYAPQTIRTSNDIWSDRSQFIYGAGYEAAGSTVAYDAPVVMTQGTVVDGTSLTTSRTDTHKQIGGQEIYNLTVTVAGLSPAIALALNEGFDAFWGTGDCANGGFLASYDDIGGGSPLFKLVPEPASLPLAGVGGLAVLFLRRTSRRPG